MLFDLICAGFLLLLALWGAFRGLIRQIFSLLGFVGGLLIARFFAAPFAAELGPQLGLSPAIATIGFSIALFFSVEVLAALLGNFLADHLGAILKSLDRLGGAALGALKGALVVWAIASLAALLYAHLDRAERTRGISAKLDLPHSQLVKLAGDWSFLGDIEKQLREAARARK